MIYTEGDEEWEDERWQQLSEVGEAGATAAQKRDEDRTT